MNPRSGDGAVVLGTPILPCLELGYATTRAVYSMRTESRWARIARHGRQLKKIACVVGWSNGSHSGATEDTTLAR